MTTIFAELNDRQDKIAVHFSFDREAVAAVKRIPGARFTPREKSATGRPFWSVPLTLDSGRRLRQEFGPALELGIGVRAWARDAKRAERQMASLAVAGDATLANVAPERAEWLRPYQRADVAMMARANVINANQPGTGKTVEVIYAVQEAGLHGPHLVVCPISLTKDPWRDELAKHAPGARVLYGDTPEQRRGAINYVWMEQKDGRADDIWLIVNPESIRCQKVADGKPILPHDDFPGMPRRILSKDHKGNAYVPKDQTGENLYEVKWGAIVADEFHKYGLGADRNTLFARGLAALRKNAQRAFALSGTPTGGKPIRLFGPLNFIEPGEFTSKWRWAGLWMTNADGDGPVDPGAGTGIGGLQPGREGEFYKAHERVMVRRTRAEALPGLPRKIVHDVWCDMTTKQAKQYRELEKEAEVAVTGGTLSTDGILSEYARLKQIANARVELRDGVVHPTEDSGKLPVLLDRLDTYGIRRDDPEPGARAIVASESQRFVVRVADYLAGQRIDVRRLDGTVTGPARDDVIDWFKAPSPDARVLVMTTQTGGVGLNLGMTGSIHILDETWNPDDQEQLEDRGMRNRTEPLHCLYYRTRETVQEYIHEVGLDKAKQTKKVLADRLRQQLRARASGEAKAA